MKLICSHKISFYILSLSVLFPLTSTLHAVMLGNESYTLNEQICSSLKTICNAWLNIFEQFRSDTVHRTSQKKLTQLVHPSSVCFDWTSSHFPYNAVCFIIKHHWKIIHLGIHTNYFTQTTWFASDSTSGAVLSWSGERGLHGLFLVVDSNEVFIVRNCT